MSNKSASGQVDEKHDVVFPGEFVQEESSEVGASRYQQPNIEVVIGRPIDGDEQPVEEN